MNTRAELEAALEALLFVTAEPVSAERLLAVFDEGERADAAAALESLRARYQPAEGRGVVLEEVAGGLRIVTAPDFHPYLRRFFDAAGANRLSMAALETLAIVAYRQPVTGPEIQDLRGKSPVAALKTLLERRMVRISGRKEVVGRPFLYATTREFLMHFGLRSLAELPPLEEFEETFGGELGTSSAGGAGGAISDQHRSMGLVSTGEAEETLGSSGFGVHAHARAREMEGSAAELEAANESDESFATDAVESKLDEVVKTPTGGEGES